MLLDNLTNKRVLVREDLNVPLKNGEITNDERIQRALPTIQKLVKQNAAIILMSHLGRPQEGEFDPKLSLAPVAERLSELLNQAVPLIKEWQHGMDVKPGQVVLLENVRFNAGEKNNSTALAKQYAALCDVFMMDAFATAHRAEASTVGVAQYAKQAIAGPLLQSELTALANVMKNPERPVVAIIGGSKVSTKFELLDSLIEKVDVLIVGGGIANTLLKAEAVQVGKSLYEPDWVARAKKLLQKAHSKEVLLPLPVDVVVAKSFDDAKNAKTIAIDAITADDCIFDIGPNTIQQYVALIHQAKTLIWNGPVGVFEIAEFAAGTQSVATAIAATAAYSVAGGGDTLAALSQFGIHDKMSYISTGGGAFLEFLEGRKLPAVAILEQRQHES